MNLCRFEAASDQRPVTLYLREYETCQTGRLSDQQARSLRERFGRYVTIRRAWEQGAWEIAAKQHVGVIALSGLRLVIEPKVSLQNLFYMLTYAYDLPDFRSEAFELEAGDDLFEFIVVIFLRQVKQLIHTVKPIEDAPDHRYLAALIMSRPVAYYFRKRFNRTEKTFPEIRVAELRELPIRTIAFDSPADVARHDRMVVLVERMLEFHKKLAAATIPADKALYRRRIEATDRQIDALVYELYGLTDDEIAIVEQATG